MTDAPAPQAIEDDVVVIAPDVLILIHGSSIRNVVHETVVRDDPVMLSQPDPLPQRDASDFYKQRAEMAVATAIKLRQRNAELRAEWRRMNRERNAANHRASAAEKRADLATAQIDAAGPPRQQDARGCLAGPLAQGAGLRQDRLGERGLMEKSALRIWFEGQTTERQDAFLEQLQVCRALGEAQREAPYSDETKALSAKVRAYYEKWKP